MHEENQRTRPDSLFSTIMRDLHFWIPLTVLIAGLLLLRQLH